jgi:competence protein ComEA
MLKPKHEFHFPRGMRTGAIALLILLLSGTFIWKILPSFIQPEPDKEEAALQQAWSKFDPKHRDDSSQKTISDDIDDRGDTGEDKAITDKTGKTSLFVFNPNTASEAELLKLGLPKYTVKTILKYRAKSPFTFKRKEDLQKLYTLSKKDYERIAPYVSIPENGVTEAHNKQEYSARSKAESQMVELNTASEEGLIALKGIGPGYSRRIINYRNALGGFLKVEQLKEVYGFPDSTYQQLKDKFTVNVTLVKQINVNIADEETLSKNPYIGRKLASNIIKLRNDIKQFKEIDQLRQVPLINEEKYRKIAPYLSTH